MSTFDEKIGLLCQQITKGAWAFSDDLISNDLCTKLKNEIDVLYQNHSLVKAKIGGLDNKVTDHKVRGDYIYWLEEHDKTVDQIKVSEEISAIGAGIRQNLFMRFERLESHFALYPAGSQYAKHLDKTKSQNTRYMTFILFLNDQWESGHGGELRIYKESDSKIVEFNIEPKMGRLVLFLSNHIYHEVLLTHQPRYSLTGWFNQASAFELLI